MDDAFGFMFFLFFFVVVVVVFFFVLLLKEFGVENNTVQSHS
jgi:hypothetical protein